MDKMTLTRNGKPLQTRSQVRFRPESWNPETREITVSLGTGVDVLRYDWNRGTYYHEQLSMDAAHIRLERLNSGAPFLAQHNDESLDALVGAFVPGTARIESGELIANVKLSASQRASDNVRDILDGIAGNTSVGYIVDEWERSDGDDGIEVRTAVDWTPYEGSVVCVPADITGGIRSATTSINTVEGEKMDEKKDAVVDQAAREAELKVAAEKAVAEYEARCSDIRVNGRKLGIDDKTIDGFVADRAVSADAAIRKMLDLRAERDAADKHSGRVDILVDVSEKRRTLVSDALEARANVAKEINREAVREFGGLSLVEIARDLIGAEGRWMGRPELFKRMTSGDFQLILANLANKTAMARTAQSEEYRWFEKIFTREDYNDFRAHSTPWLGAASDLELVNESIDYTIGSMTERNESSTAFKYGKDLPFTFEMFINDDLNAFTRAVDIFTESGWRTASNLCAALFSGNQTMGDGVALFDAAHNNVSGSNGALSAARINELDQLCLNQYRLTPDATQERIGTSMRYMLFPASLKPTVKQFFTPVARDTYATEIVAVNVPEENLLVVPSFTGTAYYGATGRPYAARYGFLRDDGGLVISQYADEAKDSLVYHGRLCFGCHVNKWEDFSYNAGA